MPLVVQAQAELSEAEIEQLQAWIRQRNFALAEESMEDAKRLLGNCGVRNAVTPQNVVRLAERLAERRILHASRTVEDYARKKRLEWKAGAQNESKAQLSREGEGGPPSF